MKIKIFVIMPDGSEHSWDEFTPEEQVNIGQRLNYQALTSLGYVPVKEDLEKVQEMFSKPLLGKS